MAQSPNSLVLFARGVIARLACWPALRLAVDQSWGGPDSSSKQTWISSVIVDEFDKPEDSELPDEFYIEDMLLQIMADEFDTILEDGSAEAVGKDIVKLWSDVKDGRGEGAVKLWEEKARSSSSRTVLSQEVKDPDTEQDSTSDEDEGSESDGVPQLLSPSMHKSHEEPEVDSEGFTLVKGKTRHR